MMRLRFFKRTTVRVPWKRLRKLFEQIMKEEADYSWQGRVNIIFTTDKHLQQLNSSFRKKDQATDVLSFCIDQPTDKYATFGEIYISVETSKRQAREYGQTLDAELLRLSCHGLLHLLGYDHIKAADLKKMEARERHFLAACSLK